MKDPERRSCISGYAFPKDCNPTYPGIVKPKEELRFPGVTKESGCRFDHARGEYVPIEEYLTEHTDLEKSSITIDPPSIKQPVTDRDLVTSTSR